MKILLAIAAILSIVVAFMVISSVRFIVMTDFETLLVVFFVIGCGCLGIVLAVYAAFREWRKNGQ